MPFHSIDSTRCIRIHPRSNQNQFSAAPFNIRSIQFRVSSTTTSHPSITSFGNLFPAPFDIFPSRAFLLDSCDAKYVRERSGVGWGTDEKIGKR